MSLCNYRELGELNAADILGASVESPLDLIIAGLLVCSRQLGLELFNKLFVVCNDNKLHLCVLLHDIR